MVLAAWDRIRASTLPATLAGVEQARASMEAHAAPMTGEVRQYLEDQLQAIERERDALVGQREATDRDAGLLRSSLESSGLGGTLLSIGIGAGLLAVIGAVGAHVYRTYHLQQALKVYQEQWAKAARGEMPWSKAPPAPWAKTV